MAVPVGGPDVHLDVAVPGLVADFQGGVEEVGPGIGVEPSGVEHAEGEAAGGRGVLNQPQPVLPDELH